MFTSTTCLDHKRKADKKYIESNTIFCFLDTGHWALGIGH